MAVDAPAAPAAPAPAAPAALPAPAAGGSPKPAAPAAPPAVGKPADPVAPPAPDLSKRRKLRVDGAEHEVDFGDEKGLEILIQKGLAADKRFAEASKYRKDSEMIANLMRTDPMSVLVKAAQLAGKDPRKVVEEWLWKSHYELENMPPEKREAELNKRELERLRDVEKKGAEAEKTRKHEAAKQFYRQNFERDIMGALQTSGLPKSPRTVERMAHYILQAHKMGVKVSAAEVAPLVRADYEQEFRELTGPMDADVLSQILGEATLKKLRERELAKLKAQGHQPPPAPGAPPAAPNAPVKKKSIAEWKAELDKKVPLK